MFTAYHNQNLCYSALAGARSGVNHWKQLSMLMLFAASGIASPFYRWLWTIHRYLAPTEVQCGVYRRLQPILTRFPQLKPCLIRLDSLVVLQKNQYRPNTNFIYNSEMYTLCWTKLGARPSKQYYYHIVTASNAGELLITNVQSKLSNRCL